MAVVMVCDAWDAAQQTCAAASWREMTLADDPAILSALSVPTLEQANEVFLLCFTVILGANVAGNLVGTVVKMLSTDRA